MVVWEVAATDLITASTVSASEDGAAAARERVAAAALWLAAVAAE